MTESVLPTHEDLLRLCATDAPNPWYPREYARASGVPRDSLDAPLNDLRLGGLMRLTEWVKGQGQGYVLTDFGEEVLKNPASLAHFRAGLQTPAAAETKTPVGTTEQSRPPTTLERGDAARKSLHEPEPARVVPVLLLLNLVAFGISLYTAVRAGIPINQFASQGDARVMEELGALSAIDLIHGEWWRLLTCAFLHFGVLHLLLNMYCLYSLGLLESLWGPMRFLIIYLGSALGGSCVAMLYYSPLEHIVVAGASGAIWGLMTSLVAWLFMNRSHLPPREWSTWVQSLGIILLINIGVSFMPGISGAAHFGGGAVGFVLATLLHVQRFAVPPRRTVATILIVLLPGLCVYSVYAKMNSDENWQRRAEGEKVLQRKFAVALFRQEVVPAVDVANAACDDALLDSAYSLTGQAPDKRSPEQVQVVQDEVKAARELVQTALAKLRDKPVGNDKLEEASNAGKDYMRTLAELLDRFNELLAQKASWEKLEQAGIEPKRKKAQQQWLEARSQL